MASSDEEGEIIPDCITNYHLVDYKEEPISFSKLPLQWSEDEVLYGLSTGIFLRGSVDNGLQEIYKKVIAWKFELSYVLPEIYLLSKDKIWIKLQKPRKSFENTIKAILITVHCLHFMKKNPEASRNTIWNHLLKAFSSYEVEPSKNDLLDHMPLINEAAVRDKEIAKSEYLAALLLEMPGKNKALHEDNRTTNKSKFIDDAADGDGDGDGDEEEDDDESDESELFDSVCALCDNGGELLCCEGRCIRSFHPTGDAGAESLCASLGYTAAQVEAIQNFLCKNCQCQQHQCFACGTLGSSNKSSGAEVFPCVSATCGHFYHPKCLAKLLHPCDETQAAEVQKNIAAGESFTCPVHKCFICKQGEDKKVYDLQFAMCRRCPKAYHRKCLPRKIAFEGNGDTNIPQRAWDGLLPNRILIYCMDHKIIPGLGTPQRNHILFPGVDGKKKQHRLDLLSAKEKVVAEKRSTVSGNVTERTVVKMKKKVEKDYAVTGGDYTKKTGGDSTKKLEEGFSRQASMSKVPDVTMKRVNNVCVQEKVYKPSTSKSSLRNDHSLPRSRLYAVKPKQQDFPSGKTKNTIAAMPGKKEACNTPPLVDAEMKKRMVALIKHSTSSFNAEEFIKKQKLLSSNACSSRFVVDKTNQTITVGKVEGSVKAVRAALKKLEEGCTTEDAKAVCEPEILKQIVKWKDKLKVYLAPFLHGMRYTSFGRHFTKVDKLKEIVDRLHWYVQDGDMIVDFCCGSNDFSLLLKERLEQMRKSCSFRNYDLIQSKNDFNFEKRDWMSVRLEELPAGSQLIMGLNPPFGVQASLANQFIEKALKFKPKLLILIVPRETKRLDKKNPPYDLIWDNDKLLSGKSFYLPGSLDVHDQQMEQWNLETPPLYLWSRPDWTAKHKAIARRHGHLSKERKELHAQEKNVETSVSNYLMEENQDCYGDFSNIVNGYGDICSILDDIPEDSDDIEHEGRRNNLSPDNLNKMQYEGKLEIDPTDISVSQMGKLGGVASLQVDDMSVDMELSTPTNSPCSNTGFKSMSESNPDAVFETHAEVYTARQGFQVLQPSFHGSHLEFGAEYAMFHTTVPNATESSCRQNGGAYLNSAYNCSTSTDYNPNG